MAILLTGAAGFIGFHVARRLLAEGRSVLGVDSVNDYYDPALKRARLARLEEHEGFRFVELDLAERKGVRELFVGQRFERVVHLAAQAGVRYSIENPDAYVDSNQVAFGNVLEGCRHQQTPHLVYASSSSVYGASGEVPFAETQRVDRPISLYAATKVANELSAHVYAHLYGLPMTGLRFFTVYGPWGRPDMAAYKFTDRILRGEPIEIFGDESVARDFTYIDDIVEGVVRVVDHVPDGTPPYRLFNIGRGAPVNLRRFVATLESLLGRAGEHVHVPLPPGDVAQTWADVSALEAAVGYRPGTDVETGLEAFVAWHREYHSELHRAR